MLLHTDCQDSSTSEASCYAAMKLVLVQVFHFLMIVKEINAHIESLINIIHVLRIVVNAEVKFEIPFYQYNKESFQLYQNYVYIYIFINKYICIHVLNLYKKIKI